MITPAVCHGCLPTAFHRVQRCMGGNHCFGSMRMQKKNSDIGWSPWFSRDILKTRNRRKCNVCGTCWTESCPFRWRGANAKGRARSNFRLRATDDSQSEDAALVLYDTPRERSGALQMMPECPLARVGRGVDASCNVAACPRTPTCSAS